MRQKIGINLVMKLSGTALGCFILTINFVLSTIFLWLAPLGDSSEMFFAQLMLTGMFIPLGLTFCIMGIKRQVDKEKTKNL